MLQIKDRQTTPNGGWTFNPPDGGSTIRGGDFGHLVRNVLDYYIKSGLPTDNLAAIVEDGICRQKPVKCAPPRPEIDGGVRSIGVADVWRFIYTMKEWCNDGTLVSQEEAERRAERCSGCRFNLDLTEGCWGCSNVVGMVSTVIGDRTTKLDYALKNCALCACFNKLAVWVPLSVLFKASGDISYNGIDTDGRGTPCWKSEDDLCRHASSEEIHQKRSLSRMWS